MKKIIFILILLLLSSTANAAVITVVHDNLLPTSGVEYIDLELDGTTDIWMAERYYGEDRAYLDLSTFGAQMTVGFVSEGTLIDGSLSWLTSGWQEPVMSIGTNYLGVYDTSLGAFFGYASIDYDGTDMVLASYTYDDTGRGLVVGEVPAPAPLALLGLGFAVIGLTRRKN